MPIIAPCTVGGLSVPSVQLAFGQVPTTQPCSVATRTGIVAVAGPVAPPCAVAAGNVTAIGVQ